MASSSRRISGTLLLAAAVVASTLHASAAAAHDGHGDEPQSVPAEEFVAGKIPESTRFDPDHPASEAARFAGRLSASSVDCTDQKTALLQDNVPWLAGNATIDPLGLGANAIELDAQGVDYCVLGSGELDTAGLGQFDRIVISSAQSQTFYDHLFPAGAIHPRLDAWVKDGGTLIANLTDNASGPGNGGTWVGRTFIGGMTQQAYYSNDDDVTAAGRTHPVVDGSMPCLSMACGPLEDYESLSRIDLDDWGYSSHGHFENLPEGATEVLDDGVGPTMVEYHYGTGSVLASMMTTEYRYLGGFSYYLQNQKLLANILSYRYRPDCDNDADCDGIATSVEKEIGTDPRRSDTDGDGLLDPWEVSPTVPGAGFKASYPDGADLGITQADVFGPSSGFCEFPDENLRVRDQLACFNGLPDPLHVDAYFELDWQDCQVDDCPEVLGFKVDPIHHAPNIMGLGYAVNMFASAPVPNPDGSSGIDLHVLVDERIAHSVNCDQDEAAQREGHFGTPDMRANPAWPAIEQVRTQAVRYIWSGHSSYSEGDCPNPDAISFGATGFGLRNMEKYDFSPLGDVNLGGQDILLTMGPLWSCSGTIAVRGSNPGPCYNATEIVGGGWFGGQPTPIFRPGIFPSQIDTPSGEIDAPYPISRMLGLTEQLGTIQLWERTLAHLIGHSFGLPYDYQVRNQPDVVGAGSDGSRYPRPSEWYATDGVRLEFAPNGQGTMTLDEPDPDYQSLARGDADGDGTAEGDDNCPGVPNGDQDNEDIDEFGDACDGDTDGDGLIEGDDEGFARVALSVVGRASEAPAASDVDPSPFDTDNDGVRNDEDADDDEDAIPDGDDNCRLTANADQRDTDGDLTGDACDRDDDGDGFPDEAEVFGGSDPLDSASTWELLGWKGTCADGADGDGDGAADAADLGCQDTDGDQNPDVVDSCPLTATTSFYDSDGDGLGDDCDPTPNGSRHNELWMADNEDIFAVGAEGEEPRQVDPSELGAMALALDADRPLLWTYGDRTLRALTTDGEEKVSVRVPGATGNEQRVALRTGMDGDVWVATKSTVTRFSADGHQLGQVAVADDIRAMSLDAGTETMWVATGQRLVAYGPDLSVRRTVALTGKPTDVEIGTDGRVLATVHRQLVSYSATGESLGSVDVGGPASVIEPVGSTVWVSTGERIAVVDVASGKVSRIDPFPDGSGSKIVDLAADVDGLWVADTTKARRVDLDGTLGRTVTLPTADQSGRQIRDLTLIPSGVKKPVDRSLGVLVLSPAIGRSVGADRVTVSGILNAPAAVTVNGVEAAVTDDLAFTAELTGLSEGMNKIDVRAIAPDGSHARTELWVEVDLTAPDAPVVSQQGRVDRNLVWLSGRSEPEATITVVNTSRGEGSFTGTATADDSGGFDTTVVAVTGDTLRVTARDRAGHTSEPITVTAP